MTEQYLGSKKHVDDVARDTLTFVVPWAIQVNQQIPLFMNMTGAMCLRNKFKGMTAVIANPGPALDKDFDAMRKYRDRFVLVGVDAALRKLQEADLDPDITVSADFTPNVQKLFKDCDVKGRVVVILVWPHASTIECLKGATLLPATALGGDTRFWRKVEQVYGGRKRILVLEDGLTVTSISASLCNAMGCSTIIFSGMNLSFPVEENQSRQVEYEDMFGNPVGTLHAYLGSKKFYEFWIPIWKKRNSNRWINSTMEGLLAEPCELLPLEMVLPRCKPIERNIKNYIKYNCIKSHRMKYRHDALYLGFKDNKGDDKHIEVTTERPKEEAE